MERSVFFNDLYTLLFSLAFFLLLLLLLTTYYTFGFLLLAKQLPFKIFVLLTHALYLYLPTLP